jgi:hypothetical protein
LDIIQVHDPDVELIIELLENKQPITLQRELLFWKGINKLIGKSIVEINNTITQSIENQHQNNSTGYIDYTLSIKNNLQPFELPMSYDWNIDIRNVIMDDKNGIFFIKQNNFMQCFGCITGEIRIVIAPNDQSHFVEPFNNYVSSINATELLDKNPIEMNYIEIIIRAGNLIYIPWGWLYFIYNPILNNECVIIDCINKSFVSLLSVY